MTSRGTVMGTGRTGLYRYTKGAIQVNQSASEKEISSKNQVTDSTASNSAIVENNMLNDNTENVVIQNSTNSAISAIDFSSNCIEHATKGSFVLNSDKPTRLRSGGHGQDCIDYLKENQLKFEIISEYENGVRLGNVECHKQRSKKQEGRQAWFPKSWTQETIKEAGEYVGKLNPSTKDGEPSFATFKGVSVGIIRREGKIATIFPDYDQEKVSKLKKRKK